MSPNDNVTAMVSQTLIIIDHAGRQVHVINLYLFHSKYFFFFILYDKEQSFISDEMMLRRTNFIVRTLFLPLVEEIIIDRLIRYY